MTQEQIITQLYTNPIYRQLVSNICSKYGRHYAEDLHSEIVLSIIEHGDDLTEIRDLFHYFFAFAHRRINNYSVQKKYGYNYNRPDCVEFKDYTVTAPVDVVYELKKSERLEQALEPHINDSMRDDYRKKLFKIYLEQGNYRKVAQVTKISFRSVAKTLQEYRNELILKIK